MEEKEVVQVLQNYRHDLMNDLQLVHGYISMKKMDKAEMKIKDCMEHFHQERKLMSLQAPLFALWIIQFNHRYSNFRINFQIHTENVKLLSIDRELTDRCNKLMDYFLGNSDREILYDLNSQLSLTKESQRIELRFFIEADGIKINLGNMDQNKSVSESQTANGFIYKFSMSY